MLKLLRIAGHHRHPTFKSVALVGMFAVSVSTARAQSAAHSSLSFPSPMQTTLDSIDHSHDDNQEHITVFGKRPLFRVAPLTNYDESRAPWETGKAIRDTMTGANTAAFGNAYNLGSLLGSDERSNETGGSFVAPRHN